MLESKLDARKKSFRENAEWMTVGCLLAGVVLNLGIE